MTNIGDKIALLKDINENNSRSQSTYPNTRMCQESVRLGAVR